MPRTVLIDADPGIDDALAICIALGNPDLDIPAVTTTAGCVGADAVHRNLQSLLAYLDPDHRPRGGFAAVADDGPVVDRTEIHGLDGLGGAQLEVSDRHHRHPADKVLADELRGIAERSTILALGPLTNIAKTLHRDPQLAPQIGSLVMLGGCVDGIGDITATSEFNIYYDPASAREVFAARTTKTLIPLDVTRQVCLRLGLLDQLPSEETRVGRLARRLLGHLFRAYRIEYGMEGALAPGLVALAATLDPSLVTTQEMEGDVETAGELTLGATVFDRRGVPRLRNTMDVAVEIDPVGVLDFIVHGLSQAAKRLG
jgi:inosine-uridine nucleoside N-ribohydrolase